MTEPFLVIPLSVTLAQSRENRKNVNFISKTKKIKKSLGWKYNKNTGKWVRNKNAIDDKKVTKYNISFTSQNFKWIQFASLSYKGVRYYALVWEKNSGEYEYPSIYSGWKEYLTTHFFILNEKQYANLFNSYNSSENTNITIKSYLYNNISTKYSSLGGEHKYTEENLLAKITTSFQQKRKYPVNYCFRVKLTSDQNKDLIRFTLPEHCGIRIPSKKATSDSGLDQEYFELSKKKFKHLLSIKHDSPTNKKQKTKSAKDLEIVDRLNQLFKKKLQITAKIVDNKGSGKIIIQYNSYEELQDIEKLFSK